MQAYHFLQLERRSVFTESVYVTINNVPVATVDDVLNTLTILLYSEKRINEIKYTNAANYLKQLGVIQEVEPGYYQVLNRNGCMQISDALSNYMDQLLEEYAYNNMQ